ncbi:MAG: hypothetical protein M1816_002487 [Peltula sp. TS41687]|nr:MAG: hypothetical protein M1816_002487 [Peltula sp. TS41687]
MVSPVIHLVIANSAEHVMYCLPKDIDDDRALRQKSTIEVCFSDGNHHDNHDWEYSEIYGLASNAARDSQASGTVFMVASGPHPVWQLI